MTEFRSLEEKRKSHVLSADEELRWSELRQVLDPAEAAADVDATAPDSAAGYYGADGQWYAYDPQSPAEQYPGWTWDAEQQQWVPQANGEAEVPIAQPAEADDLTQQASWSAPNSTEQAAWNPQELIDEVEGNPQNPDQPPAWSAQNPNEQPAWTPQDPNEQAAWNPQDPNEQPAWSPQNPSEQAAWNAGAADAQFGDEKTDPNIQPDWAQDFVAELGAEQIDPNASAIQPTADQSPSLLDDLNAAGAVDAAAPAEEDDGEVMEVGGDDVMSIGDDVTDSGELLDRAIGSDDPTLVEFAGAVAEPSLPVEEIPFAAETEVLDVVDEQPIIEALPEEQVIEPTPEEMVDPSLEAGGDTSPPAPEMLAVDVLEPQESPGCEEEEVALTEIVNDDVAARAAQLPRAGSVIGGLNPSWVDGEHRVVVHTIEGQVKRGVIRNADLLNDEISLDPVSGIPERIPTARLKAIFFILSNGATIAQSSGRKMRITFHDGRQVMGFADDYSTHDPGFFLTPADAGAADRIFIYRASVRSVAEA
ncbi:MAG TPA: hypothetical protein VE549_15340 [Myxococcaceae bacterium]|nr:hypothetical protein [Myxococcaceae bacterium]